MSNSLKESARAVWKQSTVIRPAYWRVYRKTHKMFLKTAIGQKYYQFRKDVTFDDYFPRFYNAHRNEPVDETKVIFMEPQQPTLTNNMRLIYQRLKKSGKYTIHVHLLKSNLDYRKQWKKNCAAFLSDLATAKYLFLSEGSDVLSCVDLRPETIVTQTWHGCGAFKRFGFSTADYIFGASRENMLKHPINNNYTYVTVSSPEVSWAYVEAMQLEGHEDIVKPIGVSRTDVFFDPKNIDNAYEDVYSKFPAARGKKIILYAPTFRGRVSDAEAPDQIDIRAFAHALGRDYVMIIKQHQLVKQLPPVPEELEGTFVYDGSRTMNIDELLMVSDICISDYSSLIFEYSLFERPMIFFAYDLDDYFDWRGFYYDYNEMTPGPVCTTNEQMIDYILHIDERFNRQTVVNFRNKFMSSCDGHATDRIMKLVFGETYRQG